MATSTVNPDDLQQMNAALAASDAEWQQQFAQAVAADARDETGTGTGDGFDEQLAAAFGAPVPADEAPPADVTTDDTATSTVQEQTPPVTPEADPDPVGAGSDVGSVDDKAAPSDGSFVVTLADGTEATVTNDQLAQLVELGGWAQTLSDEQRAAIAQVTEGRAKPVPTTEYEQYEAWRQSQRPRTQDTSWIEDLEPEQQAQIRQLQQQAAQVQELASRPSPSQVIAAQDNLARQEMEFRSNVNQWVNDRGLDSETGEQLFTQMVNSGLIQHMAGQYTTRHPVTGEPTGINIPALARDAMDIALVRNPELHTSVLSHTTPAQQTPATPPAVAQKIARASSLATAPSASVSQPPSNPAQLNGQEQRDAIAAFLRGDAGAG